MKNCFSTKKNNVNICGLERCKRQNPVIAYKVLWITCCTSDLCNLSNFHSAKKKLVLTAP